MTYDQLIAFLAVAEEGTFTAASERLHKSQPAVSKLVSNLESELGLQLFDRSGYRPTLTDEGRLFCERASSVIEDTEALRSFGVALGGEPEPVVRLTIDAVVPLPPIMEALSRLQAKFPTVRFEVSTERMSGAIETLYGGGAHLAVATTPGIDPKTMVAQPFRTLRIVAVARFDHPLAKAGTPVPAAMLREHAQIVLSDSARGRFPHSLNVLSRGLRWTVTEVAAKKEIIAAGMGWGGLPEHTVAEDLAAGHLVELEVEEFEADSMELHVVRRRDRPAGVVAGELWNELAAEGECEH